MMDTETATKPSLTLVRRYRAPPARLFQALTDPALISRWFGPEGGTVLLAEADPRVGGRYRIRMKPPGSDEVHDVSGTYCEVVPNERLVFSWAWITTPERESLVTFELRPVDGGTELTLTHSRFFDETARDRHREGWSQGLDRLVALFDKED